MAGQRRKLGIIAAVAAVVVVVVGVAGWYFLIRDDAPEAASIDAAGDTLDDAAEPDAGEASGTASGIDGDWTVSTSLGSFDDFSGTWAGYRVEEELSGIGAATAVGRTPDVSGSMTVADGTVSAVGIE